MKIKGGKSLTPPNKPILIAAFLFSLLFAVESDLVDSERAALVALRAAVGGRTKLWNLSADPCKWEGVTCVKDRVTELRLPGRGLFGQLPVAIGNFTQLQTLSLRFNRLSGSIPADFSNLGSLRNLYLQGNFFSGEIPEVLFSLNNLVRLNLANNNFSGGIPADVNKLTRLATLYLENNHLTGTIPKIDVSIQQFNVSFNQLTGSIPKQLSGNPKSAFDGNSLCGKPLAPCSGDETESSGGSKLSGGAIAGIVIGSVLGFLLILLILFCLCRRKKNDPTIGSKKTAPSNSQETSTAIPREKDYTDNKNGGGVSAQNAETNKTVGGVGGGGVGGGDSGGLSGGSGPKGLVFFGKTVAAFDLEDLLRASAEVLGKGTFGTAYKATFEAGLVVAVKRLKDVIVPEKEFREKMEMVGSISHENLVILRAYYFNKDEKLLVYDYMPMGSLSALLHGNRGSGRTPLSWETRASIAVGAAKAITYIHSLGPTTSHGNIKSSNILLSESYEARVSDFCLAQLVSPSSTPNRIDGYRAPEVTDPRRVSQMADVYSFGVMLLELLTGKSPTHAQLNDEGVDLPRWVQSVVEQELSSEVFDLELVRYQKEEEMVQLLQLALRCTAQYPDKRPSMAEVTRQLDELNVSSPSV